MSVDPVRTLDNHFEVFDTAANGGNADHKVSREDLEAVANGSQYTDEQREAARMLLDDPALFARLDTAEQGGGLYTADGIISRGDVGAVLADDPLFQETSTFQSDHSAIPEGTGRDNGPDATPVDAAAQVLFLAESGMGDKEASATSQFMALVSEHADDPQWLQQFFGALGAERTATFLGNVADPNRYDQTSAEFANGQVETITGVLQSMYQGGQLNDADIARLVEHWAMESGDLNTGVALLFGGMSGPGAQDMQNAFSRAATELSLAGEQDLANPAFAFSEDAIGRLSNGDRESLAAAAAYVLSKTGTSNQVSQLVNLQTDGGDAALDRFITLAMADPTRVASFDAYTYDAEDARRNDPDAPPVGQEEEYDGVAKLVQTLSWDSTYRGGPDRYLPPSPYSYATLQDVRDTVFYSAANALDGNGEWSGNTTLKDGLARILMADFDRMAGEAATANGERLDSQGHPFPQALENFAQHVLFTEPTGNARDAASKFLVDRMSQTVADINTLSDADFMAKYGTDKVQQAGLVGQVLGHVQNGMDQAIAVATDKAAAQRNGLEFGINLAWALGKDGLKLLPGGNVVSALLPSEVTGSNTYKAIQGQIESLLKKGATDEAAALLLEKFPDLRTDETLTLLQDNLEGVVEADGNHSYAALLESGYSNARHFPADGD